MSGVEEEAVLARWERPADEPEPTGGPNRSVVLVFHTTASARIPDDALLEKISSYVGYANGRWPRWLRAVEVEEIYDPADPDAE